MAPLYQTVSNTTLADATFMSQRALRLKNSIPIDRVKFSIHTLEIFNPGLKFSIPIENLNPD